MKIVVTERPQTVTVERDGQIHTARWKQSGELSEIKGDEGFLKAALTAWDGEREFELTDSELANRSGGWWAVE